MGTKRLALLLVGALIAATLTLVSPAAASHAFHTTDVKWSSYTDSSGGGYKWGGSTKYVWDGPATDAHPQFYSGVEAHTACGISHCYDIHSLKIVVTAWDPLGNQVSGIRFYPLSALSSPGNGAYEEVMEKIFRELVNRAPAGMVWEIVFPKDSQPTDYDSYSAWGQWSKCVICQPPRDAGLLFGFQVQVDLSGTYRIRVDYAFLRLTSARPYQEEWFHLYDDLTYCFNYCSYRIGPIHVTQGSWGQSVPAADVYIYDAGGYQVYYGRTDGDGIAPGRRGMAGGTYTVKAQLCVPVYDPQRYGYTYYLRRGQATVSIGPDTGAGVWIPNSYVGYC